MDLTLSFSDCNAFRSNTQRARVASERWAEQNAFCCSCGRRLRRAIANQPVLDLVCVGCGAGFELKATHGRLKNSVPDGAHASMLRRLAEPRSPIFLFLAYNSVSNLVFNLFAIPPYLFDASSIVKRKPLAPTARRAGWIGCSIRLDSIPAGGRIDYVKNGVAVPKSLVLETWRSTTFLASVDGLEQRSWTLSVMRCVESLQTDTFTLSDMYGFQARLQRAFPGNRFIREKVRQQLQVLRDAGWIRFLGRGVYQRITAARLL